MPSITIRDVPDATLDELAARAAASGLTLQEYLRRELTQLALRPGNEVVLARIAERKRRTSSAMTRREILEHRDSGRR